jgi:hypothetical protein
MRLTSPPGVASPHPKKKTGLLVPNHLLCSCMRCSCYMCTSSHRFMRSRLFFFLGGPRPHNRSPTSAPQQCPCIFVLLYRASIGHRPFHDLYMASVHRHFSYALVPGASVLHAPVEHCQVGRLSLRSSMPTRTTDSHDAPRATVISQGGLPLLHSNTRRRPRGRALLFGPFF